ncbi:MAG: ribosome-binding factor A [Bacteroidales bacterium]|nr:ribosome-binding factor A [Bacteroidales bacterium]
MESTRQNKIARLIQQDMGSIFLKEMKPKLGNSLITVTEVRITPDLSIARVYVSILPIGTMPETEPAVTATKETVMAAINANNADLRRRLGMLEGKQLRIIPELEFHLDNTLDRMENIEKLLKQ